MSGGEPGLEGPREVGGVDEPGAAPEDPGTVPEGARPEGFEPAIGRMKNFLCGTAAGNASDKGDMARLRFRNAQQDVALAERAPKEELRRLIGGCGAAADENPEGYLKIRDYLFRMR